MRNQQWRLLLSPLFPKPTRKTFRFFSETPTDQKIPKQVSDFTAIFTQPAIPNPDIIETNLNSCHVAVTHDLVIESLKGLGDSPDIARRVFDWVYETRTGLVSSKTFNHVCGVLGSNGFVNEFWELVNVMKSKGYGVKKGTYDRVYQKFEKDGLVDDLEKLKKLYSYGSDRKMDCRVYEKLEKDRFGEKMDSWVYNLINENVWGEELENKLKEMTGLFDSDLIVSVLGKLIHEPNKGLIFFRWVEESKFFKHDEASYNAMVLVLAKEDFVDKFWKVMFEMRGAGFELRKETYVEVLGKFVKKRMVKDAVDLYEFSMCGEIKPLVQDCTLLLKKIVASKELDMGLFEKTLKGFSHGGNVLTDSMFDSVFKSLISVDRVEDCVKILKVMGEVGFSPSEGLRKRIAFTLGLKGKKEAAGEFMDCLETIGLKSDSNLKTWASLIEGYCGSGNIGEALNCFYNLVEKEGSSDASYALDMLVNLYSRQNRALDVYKVVTDMVTENELKPWHSTYKVLISKLLVQGGFKESLKVLGLMKNHGFPPFLEPFIEYVSKNGTADEAMAFLSATTVKKVPSTNVFIRVFEALLKAGKHSEAHNLLSISPRVVRDHADILNLFFAMKADSTEAVVAA